MDFVSLRYSLIMDPNVQLQRAVALKELGGGEGERVGGR